MIPVRRLILPSRFLVAATSAFMALQSGCKKDPAPPTPGTSLMPAAPVAPTTALRIAGAAETPVLTNLPVLAILPTTTAAIGAIDGIVPMFTRLGYLEAAKVHPSVLTPVAAFLTDYTGVDLTNLERFTEVGIDPHGPVGVAILREGMFSVALFATVSDAGKLATTLGAIARKAGGSLSSEIVGDATVHRITGRRRMEDHYAWVVRGKVGMMIASVEDAAAVAREAASRVAATSLASNAALPTLLSDLGRGAHAALWLDVENLVAASAPALRNMFGDNARERVESLLSSTLGDDTAIALGIAVRESSVELSGRLAHAPGAPIKSLLKRDAGRPAIMHALIKPPLVVAGCRCDIQALYRAARKLVGGSERQDVVASFAKTMLGVDVEKLNEHFSGELGFAVTGTFDVAALDRMSSAESEAALKSSIGGAIVVGVTDAARVKSLVDGLLRIAPEPIRNSVKEVPGGWTIDVPEWKVVTARLGPDLLVIASDADTAESVLSRKPVKIPGMVADAAAVLEADDAAILGALDLRAFVDLLLRRESKYATDPAMPAIPATADTALLAEIEAKKKAIDRLRQDEKAKEKAIEAGLSGLAGVWAGRAVAGEKGIDGVLTATSPHPTREFFPSLFAMAAANEAKRAVRTDLWKVEDELRELQSRPRALAPAEGSVPFEPGNPVMPVEPIVPPPVNAIVPALPVAPEAPPPPG
ncbi:MAG: hypothetical protein IV100_33010 [Myxococcales bacterium]|nr:hypothetical protein [Myxococcales bacterium]